MSIYQTLSYQKDVGVADILSGSHMLADSLERLQAMPMESLPSCDYSSDFDDAGELDPQEETERIRTTDIINRLSELQSLEPEYLPNGQYHEHPISQGIYSLCTQVSEQLTDGRYSEQENAPVPRLLPFRENTKKKIHTPPPDIADGLGKRRESQDMVALEDFAVQHADWLIFEGCLCIYKKPCWIKLKSDDEALREIRRIFRPYEEIRSSLTSRDYKMIYNGLLSNPSVETLDVLHTPEDCINCRDGVLDLLTMESRPCKPSDHYFYCFDLFCHEIQSPPEYGCYFENFVAQAGNGNVDVRRQILELIALAMTGKQLKVFYAMLGPSNCGKSQIGKFLEELLGRENVMVVRHIDDFAGSFTVGSLYGKLLGMCLDLPAGTLPQSAVAILKQMVGSDPIKGERKYADPFMFDVKPLLLLAGNHPIQVNHADREDAFFNRLVTIPFANPVSDASEVIIDLYKQFLDEAAYIVHEACLAYQDLADRNWNPTRVPVPAEFSQREGDDNFLAVQDFVENCITTSPKSKVSTASLFEAYQSYAEETGHRMLNKTVFGRTVSDVLNRTIPSSESIKAIYKNGPRGYLNIALLDDM